MNSNDCQQAMSNGCVRQAYLNNAAAVFPYVIAYKVSTPAGFASHYSHV